MDIRSFKEALPGAMLSALFSVALIAGLLAVGQESDQDDDFTVTVEYDCRAVVMSPKSFPEQVINECRSRVRFLVEPAKKTSSV
jgi:hypothetical protein